MLCRDKSAFYEVIVKKISVMFKSLNMYFSRRQIPMRYQEFLPGRAIEHGVFISLLCIAQYKSSIETFAPTRGPLIGVHNVA